MRVYVGMDVHRKRSQVALVDEHGVQLANRNLANDSAELTSMILGRLAPGTPVAFEAAYGWGWLAELLNELSLEPHRVHQAAARHRRGQAQRRPGRCPHLAQLLRAELLAEAWIAPQAVRDQRGPAAPPGRAGPGGHRAEVPGARGPGRPGRSGLRSNCRVPEAGLAG